MAKGYSAFQLSNTVQSLRKKTPPKMHPGGLNKTNKNYCTYHPRPLNQEKKLPKNSHVVTQRRRKNSSIPFKHLSIKKESNILCIIELKTTKNSSTAPQTRNKNLIHGPSKKKQKTTPWPLKQETNI